MSIKRTNWVSNFNLVGSARINDNTFKIDEVSQNGWDYNSMNLGVDCGEKCGVVYGNMMGGFSTKRDNVLYVHGKDEDGKDDWGNNFTIDWDDRFNDELLDTIGDGCFIQVGLERTDSGKLFVNKFLSEYDAIKYIKENLQNDDVIIVRGNLKYSFYNDRVTMQREIKSVFLSKAEPENFRATFRQSVLLDKDSVPKDDIDVELGRAKIRVRVLDYAKEVNGVEVKGNYPFVFNFDFDFEDKERFANFHKAILKVKKDITQVNFEGEFVNSGAVVQSTVDDISDDLKALIDIGMYTEEEVLSKFATNNSERRYVLTKPVIKQEGDEENKTIVPQIFPERYTEDDLDIVKISADVVDTKAIEDIISESDSSDDDWSELFD